MSHKYMDALHKDVDRLVKELEGFNKVLKKSPTDKTALAGVAKLKPFLTKESIEKRIQMALKMDSADTGKAIKECGLPGW